MIFRNKQSFSGGEITPYLEGLKAFDRYKTGCRELYNMIPLAQGAAIRRPGFQLIYNISNLGLRDDTTSIDARQIVIIPFFYSERIAQIFILVKLESDGRTRVFSADDAGLITYSGSSTECPPGTPWTPLPTIGQLVYLDLPNDPNTNYFNIDDFDYAQLNSEIYIVSPKMLPQRLIVYSRECFTRGAIPFVNKPIDWDFQKGYPQSVCFHQQRLWFGGNTLRPQTLWASQAGDFYNFGVSSPVVASDALTFTLSSGMQSRIQWMLSNKSLQIGTASDEWTMQGSTTFAITPTSVLATRQSQLGSEHVKPLMAGSATLFVERFGIALNKYEYQYSLDSFVCVNLIIAAQHLTQDARILEIAYQQVPHRVVWCLLQNGQLLSLTYQPDSKVIAWAKHQVPGCMVLAIGVIPSNTLSQDSLWAVIRTTGRDNKNSYCLTRLAPYIEGEEATECRYLDLYTSGTMEPLPPGPPYPQTKRRTIPYNSALGNAPVDMLGALIDGVFVRMHEQPTAGLAAGDEVPGQQIFTWADGDLFLVPSTPSGLLNYTKYAEIRPLGMHAQTYFNYVLGIPYESRISPLLEEVGDDLGSSLPRLQRCISVTADLLTTWHCKVTRYFGFDQQEVIDEELPVRRPEHLLAYSYAPFTGLYRINFSEQSDMNDYLVFSTDKGYSLNIRAVIDEREIPHG